MNQFKPIISHQEGQNLFPGIPTVIKGDKAATHITMKNTKPQIAITPYGASYMSPGQDYAFAGDTVGEFPMAQMGGQEDDGQAQIMQILQIYAQIKQIPIQQLIQQIQNLSEEEQQQSITAIAQEVQQVMQEQQQQQMAQQQMPMGQEEMDMAEEEMPMAMQGGKACIDCQEQFPQAQNLNWFYKAQGGEAFPQANPYPHMYAQGGEAFPQAQTYLPYDRGSKPKPNFMFEYGGTTDIDQAYQIMKAGGLDIDPKKKKGGKFDQKSFKDYVMKNGGYLPKHQSTGPVLGVPNSRGQGIHFDYWDQLYSKGAIWGFPDGTQYNENDNTMVSPDKFKQDYPDRDPYDLDSQYDVFNINDRFMEARADADADLYWSNNLYWSNKRKKFDPENKSNTGNADRTNVATNNTATNNTTSDYIPTDDVATPAASDSTNWRDVYRQSQKKMRQNNRGTAVNYPGQTQFLTAIMGTTPRRPNVLGPAFGAALRAADFGSGMTTGREIFGRNGGSMPLPKHQFQNSTTGVNQSQTSPYTFFMPDPMRYNTAYSNWVQKNPMMNPSEFDPSNTTTNTQGYGYSFKPGSTADPNNPNFQQPLYNQNQNQKKVFGFNTPFAARMVSNLEGIGNALTAYNELKAEDKIREKMPLSSAWMPVQQSTNRGDHMMNTGKYRPDSHTYARSSPGMQSDQAFYTQTGGPLDMFEDGGVYDLDENTINMILAMGGSVEYL